MLNVVAVMGRLARDPEMRQTTTGKNVVSFSIACDRGRKDANGQSQADWLNISRCAPRCTSLTVTQSI
ncbi:single-stranded DNA-binding protein [Gemmiger formicilis]|uniref:single-stranded DNA-binding protein n=1 Tax=Gemmiger formicilis TaxID=745368 RepID=UPI003CCB426E